MAHLSLSHASLPAHQSLVPLMLYGTAWKKDQTSLLVKQALEAGFLGIDVAAQPRHYREDLVGEGMRAVWSRGHIRREDIFLQTKFTWTSGQDSDSIPFDPAETISNQVKTSINSSLHAFRPQEAESSTANSYIDCLLLHFPLPTLEQTLEAWTTLEEFFPHKIRSLGICNTSLLVLQVLYKVEAITVKPSVVQNRFQKSNGYDLGLRRYCREKGIIYQTFGVLKSNPELLDSNVVTEIAALYAESKQATLYQLMLGLGGVAVLNGTTDQTRMDEDIKAVMRQQQQLLGDSDRKSNWLSALMRFQAMVGV